MAVRFLQADRSTMPVGYGGRPGGQLGEIGIRCRIRAEVTEFVVEVGAQNRDALAECPCVVHPLDGVVRGLHGEHLAGLQVQLFGRGGLDAGRSVEQCPRDPVVTGFLQRQTGRQRTVGMPDRGQISRATQVRGLDPVVEAGQVVSTVPGQVVVGDAPDTGQRCAPIVEAGHLRRVIADPGDSRYRVVLVSGRQPQLP